MTIITNKAVENLQTFHRTTQWLLNANQVLCTSNFKDIPSYKCN